MGIVEFGPTGKQRGIVPAEELEKAQDDAAVYGVGYRYDERRLDPRKVEIIFAEDAPTALVEATKEYLKKRLERSE